MILLQDIRKHFDITLENILILERKSKLHKKFQIIFLTSRKLRPVLIYNKVNKLKGEIKMTTLERRMEVLFVLLRRRHVKISELQAEFDVCRTSIKQDIQELSRYFPIRSVDGRYGGIILDKDYKIGMKYLTEPQVILLETISASLTGDELILIRDIIKTFKKPS